MNGMKQEYITEVTALGVKFTGPSVWAYNWEEAEEKAQKLNCKVIGRIHERIESKIEYYVN